MAVGQRVRFEGQVRGVLEVTAQAAVLEDAETPHRVVALIDLFETADFEILFQPERMPLPPSGLLETFAPDVMKRALWWEEHILEVLHGLPPGVEPGTPPRPGYGPGTSVTSRQKTKAAELAALGHEIKSGAVGLRRRRYTEDGLVGLARLVDHRSVRKRKEFGDAPDAVVAAMRQAIKEGVETSTRNGSYLIWRTGEILRENGGDLAELPSRRTLYRLLDRLAAGTHATGSAVTRRSKAHGAAAPFGELTASAPGEVMQIDSTPLDVMVRFDDGVVGTRRRRTCGHCLSCRTCWTSGSSPTGRTARTRGCVIPTTRDACSPPTRSTPPWSRPAATSRSRSAARTTSNSCPRPGGPSTPTASGSTTAPTTPSNSGRCDAATRASPPNADSGKSTATPTTSPASGYAITAATLNGSRRPGST